MIDDKNIEKVTDLHLSGNFVKFTIRDEGIGI